MDLNSKVLRTILVSAALVLGAAAPFEAQKRFRKYKKTPPSTQVTTDQDDVPVANGLVRLRLVDGTIMTVEDAWETDQGIWYRQSGMSQLVPKDRIKKIERPSADIPPESTVASASETTVSPSTSTTVIETPVWIYLVGGARMEVDSVTESSAGVWYQRGPLAIFIERSRIDRIERETAESFAQTRHERRWSTGSPRIDALIKQNGAKYGVDPYLIFCVMEQESHFNARAVSPKGARGLMQLMPGTAARFGVKKSFDPAQNIAGGTRYLKLLLERFKGRVDLVLASYNAGEGAVAKFGNRVPPYSETRNYVKRISHRYGKREKTAATPTKGGTTSVGGR